MTVTLTYPYPCFGSSSTFRGTAHVAPWSLDRANASGVRCFQLPWGRLIQNIHRSLEPGSRTTVLGAAGDASFDGVASAHVAPSSRERDSYSTPSFVRIVMYR